MKLSIANATLVASFLMVVSGTQANEYSKPVGQDYPKNVYFGDTHLHTNRSADAFSVGNENLGPVDAYRFARGQAVTAHNGMQVQLRRPLDFLVIADHGEYLNGYHQFKLKDARVLETEPGKRWTNYVEIGTETNMLFEFTGSMTNPEKITPFPE